MSRDNEERPKRGLGGYGDPPRAHQFKRGQSGNPTGRPKRRPPATVEDVLARVFGRLIQAPTAEGPIPIAVAQALIEKTVALAAQGDRHARRDVFKLLPLCRYLDSGLDDVDADPDVIAAQAAEIESLRALLAQANALIDDLTDDGIDDV